MLNSKGWKFSTPCRGRMKQRRASQVAGKVSQPLGEDPPAGADVDEFTERVVSEASFLLDVELEGHDAVVLRFKSVH